jgi:hypothetical protein
VLTEVAEVPEVRVLLWLIEPDDAPDVPPDGRVSVAPEGRASLAGAGSGSALGAPGSTMRRIVGEGGGPRSGAAAGAGIMGVVVRREWLKVRSKLRPAQGTDFVRSALRSPHCQEGRPCHVQLE